MTQHAEIRHGHEISRQQESLATLAAHWEVPVSEVAALVGADFNNVDRHVHLSSQQARYSDCLREIDLNLLASYGTSRRWPKRKSKTTELAGKTPLEFLQPLDIGSASTVLRLAGRRCAGRRP